MMVKHGFDALHLALAHDASRRGVLAAAGALALGLLRNDPRAALAKRRHKKKRRRKKKPHHPPPPCSGGACAAVPQWAGDQDQIDYCEFVCRHATVGIRARSALSMTSSMGMPSAWQSAAQTTSDAASEPRVPRAFPQASTAALTTARAFACPAWRHAAPVSGACKAPSAPMPIAIIARPAKRVATVPATTRRSINAARITGSACTATSTPGMRAVRRHTIAPTCPPAASTVALAATPACHFQGPAARARASTSAVTTTVAAVSTTADPTRRAPPSLAARVSGARRGSDRRGDCVSVSAQAYRLSRRGNRTSCVRGSGPGRPPRAPLPRRRRRGCRGCPCRGRRRR